MGTQDFFLFHMHDKTKNIFIPFALTKISWEDLSTHIFLGTLIDQLLHLHLLDKR